MGETKTLTVYKYTSISYNSTKQSGPVKSVSTLHITNKHHLTNYNRVPLIPNHIHPPPTPTTPHSSTFYTITKTVPCIKSLKCGPCVATHHHQVCPSMQVTYFSYPSLPNFSSLPLFSNICL